MHVYETSPMDLCVSCEMSLTLVVVCGIENWFSPNRAIGGLSVSLYDRKSSKDQERSGDPIADVFAAVDRNNHGVLAIADGCNWGDKSRLAAKCAVQGCMAYLNSKLYSSDHKGCTVQDVFSVLLRSFDEAHKHILTNGGTTTTLTAAIVCPLVAGSCEYEWCACVVSVGDSQAYVYRARTGTVHEITRAVHQGERREMRDSGGCLGMSFGDEPDLRNLLCTFSPVDAGDIVFLTTDGLSDNFDPVVRRDADSDDISDSWHINHIPLPSNSSLPTLTAEERELNALTTMASVIGSSSEESNLNKVLGRLLDHVVDLTDKKRSYLEKVLNGADDLKGKERRDMDRIIKSTLKQLPGKLDHCTMVGYIVGGK